RLAGPEIAGLLETIDVLPLRRADSGTAVPAPAPAPGGRTPHELRFARTCYDHLAGSLAVALHGLLIVDADGHPQLAPEAPAALARLGLDSAQAAAPGSRRPRLRNCLDWSERRPHLAGATGAALLTLFLERKWVVRRRTPRAVRLTRAGQEALTAAFGPHPCWQAAEPATAMRS
ncbi:MAG: transcriptional regulator, partial [Actinomycetota bacterium]